MEFLTRKGLILDIHTDWYEQKGITLGEAKAIAYLFNVKKDMFEKSSHIYKLKMSDRSYWFSTKFDKYFNK